MAAPSKPKPKNNRLGDAPQLQDSTHTVGNNIKKASNAELVSINFKVEAEFRHTLKNFAAQHDMSMVDVIKEAFEMYRSNKGG